MKTDRELLELAAKAAGYNICWHHANQCHMITEGTIERKWRPNQDDGDAMRLAVDSRIDILFFNGFGEVRAEHCSGNFSQCDEDYSDDVRADTRRAILRAAAAIGAMP